MSDTSSEPPMDPRDTMDRVISDAIAVGAAALRSHDDSIGGATSIDDSNQSVALRRVVDVVSPNPENRISRLQKDKYVIQRSYGVTSFIYLANGHK